MYIWLEANIINYLIPHPLIMISKTINSSKFSTLDLIQTIIKLAIMITSLRFFIQAIF